MLTDPITAACPRPLRVLLARYLAGEISAEITLMHFAVQVGGPATLNSILGNLAAALPKRQELMDLVRMAAANTDHLAEVAVLAKEGLVNIAFAADDRIAAIRDQFDRAVALAPEAAVALYSLGSPNILDRATNEIVAKLSKWDLLRADAKVLDIGCGIGRIERALAPLVGAITAIDVSCGMIKEACQRCRDLPNVTFAQCDGRDLAGFVDRSFDLMLAIDSFPYLFAADPAIVQHHVHDAARLLRRGGTLVILNFSYRGDGAADRHDVERLAAASGFVIQRASTRDFTLWDGTAFLLVLPAHRG